MSNTVLLSIVVPVYNVAPYLNQFLDSVFNCQAQIDELILIDDGSTDETPQILKTYAEKFSQIKLIKQENQGVSVARNAGMKIAEGKYIAFIDADDFLEPDAYIKPLRLIEEDKLDMVIFNARYHHEGREPDSLIYPKESSTGIISGRDWLAQQLAINNLPHMVWMHLYRTDFLKANGWQYIPGLMHQDVVWTTEVLLAATRIRYISDVLYNYRVLSRSTLPDAQKQKRLERIVKATLYNANALSKIAERSDIDEKLVKLIRFQLVDGALSIFFKLKQMPDLSVKKSYVQKLKQDGFYSLLLKNAQNFTQYRKILKRKIFFS